MFYGCLHVSDLINLNDQDIDFGDKTIRIKEGKGGRETTARYMHVSDQTKREKFEKYLLL